LIKTEPNRTVNTPSGSKLIWKVSSFYMETKRRQQLSLFSKILGRLKGLYAWKHSVFCSFRLLYTTLVF
jgi:hypothetical protein